MLSEYARKLPASVRSRYEEKVLMCEGKDPLSLSVDETVTDTSAYLKVEECDVKDYLVGKTSFITRAVQGAQVTGITQLFDKWMGSRTATESPSKQRRCRDWQESYIPTAAKYKSALLCTLFNDCAAPSWQEDSEECDKLERGIRVEQEVLHLIEEETRAQSSCRKWFLFRAGRVAASCAKAACSASIEDP
ncbi:hypothetical protein HPB48_022287 [Haemaphysalis longicornis]|uniref:Uncharacterized protein n=1 Tax=Haemaphysalis longicornis TaxID=44386 RepID=A0A9J6GU32_HAELO|nr:hypothetical protein HPB48_022287 [Haemaphysalis longicornis]